MWMMEDLSYTDTMVKPLKKLNVDDMVEEIKNAEGSSKYEESNTFSLREVTS